MPGAAVQPGAGAPVNPFAAYATSAELGGPTQTSNRGALPQIINLLRVPTSQQVMLKVRIAELNRTSLRQIGSNFLGVDPSTGASSGRRSPGPIRFAGQIGQPGNLLIASGNEWLSGPHGSANLGPAGTATDRLRHLPGRQLRVHAQRPADERASQDPRRAQPGGA